MNEQLEELYERKYELEMFLENFDVSEYVSEDDYWEMLDEVYGDVEVCGMTFSAADALKKLDPIAYNVGYNDYIDSIDASDLFQWQDAEEEIAELELQIADLEEELEEA